MRNRLNAMAVRVEYKGRIVVGMVLRPRSGRAVVPATRAEGGGMESPHRFMAGRAQAQMHARIGCRDRGLMRDRELDAERSWRRAIVRSAAGTADPDPAKVAQRSVG